MLDCRVTLATLVFVCCTGTAHEPPASRTAPDFDLTPDAHGSISPSKIEQLFRVVGQKDIENDKRQRDYTYIKRQVANRLDVKGNIKSTEAKTYEVLEIYGEQVERLIEKADKPLSQKEAAKEEEKIQKIVDNKFDEVMKEGKKLSPQQFGTEVHKRIKDALDELIKAPLEASLGISEAAAHAAAAFLKAVTEDAQKARGAIALVLSRPAISSLLIDNLNASIHLRALLTDLFLIEQALKS